MPSQTSTTLCPHRLNFKLSILISSAVLVGCGGGSSSSGGGSSGNNNSSPSPVVTTTTFTIKTPVDMRDVNIKVTDNINNTIIFNEKTSSTTSVTVNLPSTRLNQLYLVEITTLPTSLVYDFNSGQYVSLTGSYHGLIQPTSSTLRTYQISPASEAIYQRAIIRSGQLPTEQVNPNKISLLHFEKAQIDVNTALVNAFRKNDIPTLTPTSSLLLLTQQQSSKNDPNLYIESYLSFGYLHYWFKQKNNTQTYADFVRNISLDLKDGHLDGKTVIGEQSSFTPIVTTSQNIDPEKNTTWDIADNQKAPRENFGNQLRDNVLSLAQIYNQPNIDPTGYDLLLKKQYSGVISSNNSSMVIRPQGAGDYRRAVGFANSTATCNGSSFPCKQGLTGINLVNFELPSIEYLVGKYKDSSTNCELNVRATGELELIKGVQSYQVTLNGDTTDNLLQTDEATRQYLLNSSSSEPTLENRQYQFIQLRIQQNKVLGAVAGLDQRQAPDSLQTKQLECNFS